MGRFCYSERKRAASGESGLMEKELLLFIGERDTRARLASVLCFDNTEMESLLLKIRRESVDVLQDFLLSLLGEENIELIEDIVKERMAATVEVSRQPRHIYCVAPEKKISRRSYEKWEELVIEATSVENTHNIAKEAPTGLPRFYRDAFDYKEFNLMQSAVVRTVTGTSENLLVCAPTGTGKTEIAVLSILKVFCTGDRGRKAVYIAPMKALVGELVSKLQRRFSRYSLRVLECTGDSSTTAKELHGAHVIVATPEKWDIVTRREDIVLEKSLHLVVIDEVHLLRTARGPVLETIVSRTMRQVAETQQMVRIVGLSATLPNYVDVAEFLGVNPASGLFFFGDEFRSTPLSCVFCATSEDRVGEVAVAKTLGFVERNEQVLHFTHTRNSTHRIARSLVEAFRKEKIAESPSMAKERRKHTSKLEHRDIQELVAHGIGIHHAGISRGDRNIIEALFERGGLRVLVCTATLAWGVNLPAHAVVVEGTKVWNAAKGTMDDLCVLDVLQIFGRAGRPQYDTHGEAVLVAGQQTVSKYFNALAVRTPIESRFLGAVVDELNTELVSGNVARVPDGVEWLRRTYMYIRMKKNPLAYGVREAKEDPRMEGVLTATVERGFERLLELQMARRGEGVGGPRYFPTETGRIACLFYLKTKTVETFLEAVCGGVVDPLYIVSRANEFDQLTVRDSEIEEIATLNGRCFWELKDELVEKEGKVSVLAQAHLLRLPVRTSSLLSDLSFVSSNFARLLTALLELAVEKKRRDLAMECAVLFSCFSRRVSPRAHPLCQVGFHDKEAIATLREMGIETVESVYQRREHCDFVSEKIFAHIEQHPRCSVSLGEKSRFLVVSTDFCFDAREEFTWRVWLEHGAGFEERKIRQRRGEKTGKTSFYLGQEKGECTVRVFCEGWLFTERVFRYTPMEKPKNVFLSVVPRTEFVERTGYVEKEICRLVLGMDSVAVFFSSLASVFRVAERLITRLPMVSEYSAQDNRTRVYSSFGISVFAKGETRYPGRIVLCARDSIASFGEMFFDGIIFLDSDDGGGFPPEAVLEQMDSLVDGGSVALFCGGGRSEWLSEFISRSEHFQIHRKDRS
ncbi:MAG: Ski2-like ATP-dependent RNA helicase [Amphiamblys sp. WSBS2006]|nr:MAG: Ski2-like ATP-dependent RNA helicase [Amphiamblys sp. WSBS2006]